MNTSRKRPWSLLREQFYNLVLFSSSCRRTLSMFTVCTTLRTLSDKWNYTYRYLDIAYNKFSCKKLNFLEPLLGKDPLWIDSRKGAHRIYWNKRRPRLRPAFEQTALNCLNAIFLYLGLFEVGSILLKSKEWLDRPFTKTFHSSLYVLFFVLPQITLNLSW